MSNDNVVQGEVIEFPDTNGNPDDNGFEPEETEPWRPILAVWRAALEPAQDEAKKKVTPQWASRIIASSIGVSFADMNDYRDYYFGLLAELEAILIDEIKSDDECLKIETVAEDVEVNSKHYANLIFEWQKCFITWEHEWDTADELAAVKLAAIGEAHKMFFGPTGMTAQLDNIQFRFDEQMATAMQAELEAHLALLREGDHE